MSSPYERERAVRTPNPLALALALLPVLASIAAIVDNVTTGSRWIGAVPHLIGLSAMGVYGYLHNALGLRRKMAVRADREELVLGARRIPRHEIRVARYVPLSKEDRRHVRVEWGRLQRAEVGVRDRDDAMSLLEAMGMDAAHVIATFRGASFLAGTNHRAPFAFIMGIVAVGLSGVPFRLQHYTLPLAPVGMLLFLAFALIPSRIDVGADGVLVRWLHKRRFIPTRDIESVEMFDRAFGRGRTRGALLKLPLGERYDIAVFGHTVADAAELVERIEEAVHAHRAHASGDTTAALARGRMPVRVWIRSLRTIGTGANATHRVAPVPHDRLWEILEDPGASASDRAAAATALSSSDEPDARARVRVAADAIAEPCLRVAIAAAAEGDDAELASAMTELSADAERA